MSAGLLTPPPVLIVLLVTILVEGKEKALAQRLVTFLQSLSVIVVAHRLVLLQPILETRHITHPTIPQSCRMTTILPRLLTMRMTLTWRGSLLFLPMLHPNPSPLLDRWRACGSLRGRWTFLNLQWFRRVTRRFFPNST